MTTIQPESKKHHFVPRSLLKYFRPPGDGEHLYVFNKQSGQVFRTSLMNAGSENGFNTFEEGTDKINFEDDFQRVDGLLATRLREVHEARNLSTLTAEHRRDWADLVAVQLLRTPIVRSTMTATFAEINSQVTQEFGVGLAMQAPSENDARKVARGLFKDRHEAIQSLLTKDFVLFEAGGDIPFRISDRPVTLDTSLPFDDTGLASLGVAVFMPLGKNLMLGLFCPSIGRKLNKVSFDKLELPKDSRARLEALKHGLATGSIVRLDQTTVKRHNAQQISSCTRFVYGPTKDFGDALAIVAANPHTRVVRSSMNVGKMGQGPGPRRHMPMGSWLVLVGRNDAYMLEVTNVSDAEPLEVTVQNKFTLAEAMKDGPFSEMQYYVDKLCRCGMREVHLVPTGEVDACRFQVRHVAPALDGLMSAIGRGAR